VRRHIKSLRTENGQALVEFAFVIPLVLMFLFAIVDFGLALNQQNSDTNIANVAVREAAVVGTTTYAMCGTTTEYTLSTWASCESTVMGGPTLSSVCVGDIATSTAPSSTTYTTGDPIEVKVSSQFSWLKIVTAKVSNLSSGISGSATMRMEGSLTGTNAFLTPVCSS
jgi:Flp pilus assembly protein TadG